MNSLYRRGEHEHRSDVRPSKPLGGSAWQKGDGGEGAHPLHPPRLGLFPRPNRRRPPPMASPRWRPHPRLSRPWQAREAQRRRLATGACPPLAMRLQMHGSWVAHTSTHVWRCGGTGRRRRTDTAACTHKHTRAQDVGRATIIIASSRVRDDGRSIKSRSKASLLAGRIDCRQIAGRTTHTEPRRRAVTEAEGGGGVETEPQ